MFYMGALYSRYHDCKIAPLCTLFMYTAVAILLPAYPLFKAVDGLFEWWCGGMALRIKSDVEGGKVMKN